MRIHKFAAVLAAGSSLAGCNALTSQPSSFVAAAQECTAKQPRFIDAWGCLQARYATGAMGEADPKLATFLKFGDDLAGEVAADRMSNAEAKKRLLQSAANADRA